MVVIPSFSYCYYITLEVIAAFIFQLKIGMKIIIRHTQIKLLCVAQVSDLYMKVNKRKMFTFILDIIFKTNKKNVIKHSPLGKYVRSSTSLPLLLSDLLCRDVSLDSLPL